MKRERDKEGRKRLDIANCLMLLCDVEERKAYKDSSNIEFKCKTCNRKFSSFQALGGHRASHNHKRPKLEGEDELKAEGRCLSLGNKPRMHECSICGMEFSLGQALGGHMRKHRASLHPNLVVAKEGRVLKRVVCLDLNLTPLENDLKFLFGNMAPPVVDASV